MSEFTPGPWTAGKLCTIFHGEGYNFSNGDVEVFPPPGESGPVAIVNSEANARLIAAAPELYEAIKHVCQLNESGAVFRNSPEFTAALGQLHIALAKADAK